MLVIKSYTVVYKWKIFISRGLGKKFLPKPNHPYPPQKSNGQPLKGAVSQILGTSTKMSNL